MRSLIFKHPLEKKAAAKPKLRAPRDPAPSKWHYRYQRWMLTPGVKTAVRVGTPLAQLYAIETARVRVGEGGALHVDVTPRIPVAVWRDHNTLRLVDADGIIAGIIEERAERRDLPLIAGDGAFENIDEALTLFQTAAPIRERVRGLVRMGDRRWDMVLDRGQRLMLPAENPITALDRMIVLNDAQDMLDRDVAVVDMRNPKRAVLRMTAEASNAYRRVSDTGD